MSTSETAPTAAVQQQPATQQSSNNDTFQCQWSGCGERTSTAELLYDHVCERHVGRKSTNNLNLTCQWGNCRTTTVKRDHITSHIRVHVPLKPHKCDFCGKAFKRPQDLKKHVKTHADDPISMKSPEPSGGVRQHSLGYNMGNGKSKSLISFLIKESGQSLSITRPDFTLALIGDLQALAATATGYYENPMQQSGGSHGYTHQNGTGYYAPTQQPNTSSYGPVYYAINSHGGDMSHHTSFESRKRDYDALNDFFGDAKRRQFNPASYADVGDRLMAFQGLQLPMIHGGVMPDYQPAPAMVSGGGHGVGLHGPMPQQQYALPPMPNLRTKNDLLNIDQFLEQMQATVYENPNTAAAAGVAHPGAHTSHGGMNFRQSNSPPGVHIPSSHAASRGSDASMMAATSSQSTHGDTPALTPQSSAMSYTSAHSPLSAASGNSTSPLPHSGAQMYPTLPATSAHTAMAGYPVSSTAPASVLGTIFDSDQRRRYSGGQLQKASKPPRSSEEDEMDTSSGTTTPAEKSRKSPGPSVDGGISGNNKSTSPSLIDPTLSGSSPPADSEAEKAQEAWVENIRVIEALRKFIAEKLEKNEYDDDKGADQDLKDATDAQESEVRDERKMTDAQSLYPILKAVEGRA
ncbi:MAG: hypothetical protein M1830_004894 [Pleopsidium flavum]|nr:MAG: hypothetical protein M1830_004894 [Pleopsidium flavum]